jgi:hypothetical protein
MTELASQRDDLCSINHWGIGADRLFDRRPSGRLWDPRRVDDRRNSKEQAVIFRFMRFRGAAVTAVFCMSTQRGRLYRRLQDRAGGRLQVLRVCLGLQKFGEVVLQP